VIWGGGQKDWLIGVKVDYDGDLVLEDESCVLQSPS